LKKYKSSLSIFSEKIVIKNCQNIFGNVIFVADTIQIKGKSAISSVTAGCNVGDNLGSPGLVVNSQENCGLNGGSYGGRGGTGLSKIDVMKGVFNQTVNCIINSVNKMTTYGDPMNPIDSGSTGSQYFDIPEDVDIENYNAPGTIIMLSKSFSVSEKSRISAGVDDNHKKRD
jgi:hypothetical protein